MQTDVARRTMTAEAFEQYAALPENAERRLELIAGDIVESVADFYSSEVGVAVGAGIGQYVYPERLGRLTGADGGYAVGGDRLMPTVAYTAGPRPPGAREIIWNPNPPDLAVIIRSYGDQERWTQAKRNSLTVAGTVVWLVDPPQKRVEIYAPGQPVIVARIGDSLRAENILPGFTLAVNDIFPE